MKQREIPEHVMRWFALTPLQRYRLDKVLQALAEALYGEKL